MIRALITGTIYGAPQARTAGSGNQYATAKVRADGKDGTTTWCSVIAFGEIADRLLTLGDSAALSISGRAEVNAWLDKQGEPKAGLSVVVDEIATLKGKPRRAKPRIQHTEGKRVSAKTPQGWQGYAGLPVVGSYHASCSYHARRGTGGEQPISQSESWLFLCSYRFPSHK